MGMYYGDCRVIQGNGFWYDVNTLFASNFYAHHIPRIFQLKKNKLVPVPYTEVEKISFASMAVLSQFFFMPYSLLRKSVVTLGFYGLSFLISSTAAARLGLRRSWIWGSVGVICHIAYAAFIFFSRRSQDVYKIQHGIWVCSGRQEKRREIAAGGEAETPEIFAPLPPELIVRILTDLGERSPDLDHFSLTCKWATKMCWNQSFFLRLVALEAKMPQSAVALMKQKLGDDFVNAPILEWQADIFDKGVDEPLPAAWNQGATAPGLTMIWNPSQKIPRRYPKMVSDLSFGCPFVTINYEWIGKHKIMRTITPANTLAWIVVCQMNQEAKPHLLIFTQASSYDPNEWWLVDQAYGGKNFYLRTWQEFIDTGYFTLENYLSLHKYTRIVFTDKGVVPESQAAWNWFSLFLSGTKVPLFYKTLDPNDIPLKWEYPYRLQFQKAYTKSNK